MDHSFIKQSIELANNMTYMWEANAHDGCQLAINFTVLPSASVSKRAANVKNIGDTNEFFPLAGPRWIPGQDVNFPRQAAAAST